MSEEVVQVGTGLTSAARQLLGPAPVLRTEEPRDYELLLLRVADTLQLGDDYIEIVLAKAVVDVTWEKLRYVRMKKGLIELAYYKRLEDKAYDIEAAAAMRHRVKAENAKGTGEPVPDPEDVSEQVKAVLKHRPTELDHVSAMKDCLDDYERVERLDAGADLRLRAALDEFQRYREGLGRQLRQVVHQVIQEEVNEAVALESTTVSSKEFRAVVELPPSVAEVSSQGPAASVDGADPVVPADEVQVAPAGVSPGLMTSNIVVPDIDNQPAVADDQTGQQATPSTVVPTAVEAGSGAAVDNPGIGPSASDALSDIVRSDTPPSPTSP